LHHVNQKLAIPVSTKTFQHIILCKHTTLQIKKQCLVAGVSVNVPIPSSGILVTICFEWCARQ